MSSPASTPYDIQTPHSVWFLLRGRLITAAVMCVLAVALAATASWVSTTMVPEQDRAQEVLVAAVRALENTQSDRTRLEQNLQLFDSLKKSPFSRMPDRMLLLEALENAARDLYPSDITWELRPQELLKPLNDDKTGAVVAQLFRVPMKLNASGVHENEWLGLLTRLQGSSAGYFRVDACTYEKKEFRSLDKAIPAVNVTCNLSWLYAVAASSAPKTP